MNKEKIKRVLNYFLFILTVCLSIGVGFIAGKNFHKLTPKEVIVVQKIKYITKKEVNIAVDEASRLILIDNRTGEYIIYSDSVGNSIFSLYAKQIWNKNEH